MSKYSNRLVTLLCLLSALQVPITVQATRGFNELPDIGDSSSTMLSHNEEIQIDREMMRQLSMSGALLNDPIINEYIQGMGQEIASVTDSRQYPFHFFVVKDASINAFAMPGGHIGVNAGLIMASRTESELAAVIAHEISHVTQHHIARSVEKSNQTNAPLTAAIIAAILLGADPQITNAAIAAGVGGSAQMSLNFSRAYEKEADSIGMQLLSASNYDPRGMGDFFARLQSESRYYGDGVPEFLRTHPVTSNRIAEARDRSRQYPAKHMRTNIHYLITKARLVLLMTDQVETLEQELATQTPRSKEEREANRYLQALILQRKDKVNTARKQLKALLRDHPDRIAYIYTLGRLEQSQKQDAQAANIYKEGLRQYPGNTLLTLALAENLITQKQLKKARQLLQQLLRNKPETTEAYRLNAELEAQSGNKAASYLARAEYYYLLHEPHSALDQLNTAKRLPHLSHYFASRIDARIRQIGNELGGGNNPAQTNTNHKNNYGIH